MMKILSFISVPLIALAALVFLPSCSESKEKAHLPVAKDGDNAVTADGEGLHDKFDVLLKKHVKDGVVSYKGFAEDQAQLKAYLDLLAATDPAKLNKNQRLTYWINAYNAFTIQLMLDNKSIIKEGIKDIPSSKRWKRDDWKVGGGKTISLDAIEHKILRVEYNEPRIHFAIVCASYSCPDLRAGAFTTDKIDSQLDEQAKLFFKDSTKGYKLDKAKKTIHLSKLLSWFDEDFGRNDKAVIERIIPWLPEADQEWVKANSDDVDIDYYSYSWKLNGSF